jgi:hypothetical protein
MFVSAITRRRWVLGSAVASLLVAPACRVLLGLDDDVASDAPLLVADASSETGMLDEADPPKPDPPNPGGETPVAQIPTVEIKGGERTSCAVGLDGALRCWGVDCSVRSTVVKRLRATVMYKSGVRRVAIGESNLCVLKADKTVECVGDNRRGQLGTGSTVSSAKYVQVVELAGS